MKFLKYIAVMLACCCYWYLPANAATGPGTGTVIKKSGHYQTVTESKFRELFHHYICDSLGKIPDDIVISRLKINGNRPINLGVVDFQVYQKSKGHLKGYVRLAVIVSVESVAVREVGLSAWVDVFGPVVCAARTLNKGETIDNLDVYLARKNISRMPASILTDKSMVIGLTAKSAINENTCLRDYMLKRTPTLEKGEMVTILAEIGGLRVTTPGKTLERGFAGDMIRVQNTMSKKRVYARIVDDSTVEVDF
jgi:flagella basal body P-ring formation protein FlgA